MNVVNGVIDTSRHVQLQNLEKSWQSAFLQKCFSPALSTRPFVLQTTGTRCETFWLWIATPPSGQNRLCSQGLDFLWNYTEIHLKKGQQSLLLDSADILINILTFSSAQTTIPWLDKYDLQLCQKVTESLMFQRDVNTAQMHSQRRVGGGNALARLKETRISSGYWMQGKDVKESFYGEREIILQGLHNINITCSALMLLHNQHTYFPKTWIFTKMGHLNWDIFLLGHLIKDQLWILKSALPFLLFPIKDLKMEILPLRFFFDLWLPFSGQYHTNWPNIGF